MAQNESLKKALDFYLEQKRAKLEEVRQLDIILARLGSDAGASSSDVPLSESPSDSMGNEWQDRADISMQPAESRANVRADEFFGMTYTSAAKAYLEKVGHAVSMDELMRALSNGGCKVGGKDPKKTLYISLIRDVRNFVNIPGKSGILGLRKFYPNLKSLNEKRNEKAPKAKRKKRGRTKQAVVVPE